jgi:DNA-binding NarL/FixJ family response regulator
LTKSGMQVRVVVVDDHTLFREGLRELLCTEPRFTVVAEGASGPEAVALVAAHRPDVILLDVEMPGPGAEATITEIRRVHPATQIIVLTMHDDAELVRGLLDLGAAAYLVKTIVREQLIAAVHSVGGSADTVLLSVPRETMLELERPGQPTHQLLSAREVEVLELVAQARSNAEVAAALFIAEGTVKRHLTNIYAKLGAVSRVDAIRKAIGAKLIRGLDAER